MYETEKELLIDIVKTSNGILDDSFIQKFNDSNLEDPTLFIDKLMSELVIYYSKVETFPLMFASSLGDYTDDKNVDFAAIVSKYK